MPCHCQRRLWIRIHCKQQEANREQCSSPSSCYILQGAPCLQPTCAKVVMGIEPANALNMQEMASFSMPPLMRLTCSTPSTDSSDSSVVAVTSPTCINGNNDINKYNKSNALVECFLSAVSVWCRQA